MSLRCLGACLAILAVAGCAIFIPPDIYSVPIRTGLPQEALDTFNTIDLNYRIELEPYEDAEMVSIKAPSGHYYEFGFWSALDSTLTRWADYKFIGDSEEPDGVIHVRFDKFISKTEYLNKGTRDFLYELGIVAKLSIQNHEKTWDKPIIVNLKIPVEGDETSIAQIKEGIDYALLEFIIDIDLFVDREMSNVTDSD